jgi:hypothetical protein
MAVFDTVSHSADQILEHSTSTSTSTSPSMVPDSDLTHDTNTRDLIARPLSQTILPLPRNWKNETILPQVVDSSTQGFGYGVLKLMCRVSRKAVAIGSMMVIGYGGM